VMGFDPVDPIFAEHELETRHRVLTLHRRDGREPGWRKRPIAWATAYSCARTRNVERDRCRRWQLGLRDPSRPDQICAASPLGLPRASRRRSPELPSASVPPDVPRQTPTRLTRVVGLPKRVAG